MQGKYRVSGALFSRDVANGPVYSGTIEIDGVKTAISIWEKVSAAGNQYLQITEDKRGQAKIDGGANNSPQSGASKFKRQAPVAQPKDDLDNEDIPF